MSFKKRDIMFILLIFAVCFVIITLNNICSVDGDTVFVYYNGQLYKSVPINEDTQININNTNTVIIEDGYAYMSHADCPDKLCVKQGKINSSAKDIVCLPNRVRVRVTSHTDIDSVSQ